MQEWILQHQEERQSMRQDSVVCIARETAPGAVRAVEKLNIARVQSSFVMGEVKSTTALEVVFSDI